MKKWLHRNHSIAIGDNANGFILRMLQFVTVGWKGAATNKKTI